MCGFLLPAEGEPCPTVVPTPFETLGGDISSNATCSAFYSNPPHQKHVARPLEGQGFEVTCPSEHVRRDKFVIPERPILTCRTHETAR